jgi:hypothetical protein
MKCVKITRPESHGEKFSCICPLADFSAADEFDGAEPGEKITLELAEMTEEELKALPDFGGW